MWIFTVYGFLWRLFWLWLLCFGNYALAQTCTKYEVSFSSQSANGFLDQTSACAAGVTMVQSILQPSCPTCSFYGAWNQGLGRCEAFRQLPGYDPVMYNPTVSPYTVPISECVDKCEAQAGKLASDAGGCVDGRCAVSWTGTAKWPGNGPAGKICVDGCAAAGNVVVTGSISPGSTKQYAIVAGVVGLGSACTEGSPAIAQSNVSNPATLEASTPTGEALERPEKNAWEDGYCPGEVNGHTVWVRCGVTSSSTTASGTVTVPDGSGTATVSTTSTTTNTCDGAGCTSTVETSTGGSPPATTTTKKDTNDFCKDSVNANTPICKAASPSDFGGSCAAGFTCNGGDAALCAAARGIWESRCTVESLKTDPANAAVAAGAAALTGSNPANHPREQKTTVNVGNLTTTNPFGGGCPVDTSITVIGQQIVIPLSSACSVFQLMGSLLVGLTMLCAAFIVAKGV